MRNIEGQKDGKGDSYMPPPQKKNPKKHPNQLCLRVYKYQHNQLLTETFVERYLVPSVHIYHH